MRKVGVMLFAAFLVVALPLAAVAATQVYKAKDREVDFWELCWLPPVIPLDGYKMPVGPAYEFADILKADSSGHKSVWIHYVGTEKFNARVKNGDVGWNRNVHGTAIIYGITAGGTPQLMAVEEQTLMSILSTVPKINLQDEQGSVKSMYPYSCWAMAPGYTPINVSKFETLYSGPFQVEEVVQDDGGDFGCFDQNTPGPVNFQDCWWNSYGQKLDKIDYLMLHVKITGNKVYFFKQTIHEPGLIQFEDHRGLNVTLPYWP